MYIVVRRLTYVALTTLYQYPISNDGDHYHIHVSSTDYGQPGTQPPQEQYPTSDQPTSSEAPPPQPGYPPQTGYDYSQWPPQTDLTSQPFGGQESSEDWRQHQQGSISRKEAESVPSGDSHVTKKKSEEEKEARGKGESKKGMVDGCCLNIYTEFP